MGSRAKFHIYAVLGNAGGTILEVDVPGPVPLREPLSNLARQQGFYGQLFEETGELKRSFTVLVNGSSIYHLRGLDTILKGGEDVTILAFAAGG
jgi:molybdopterin converting factor small subunit